MKNGGVHFTCIAQNSVITYFPGHFTFFCKETCARSSVAHYIKYPKKLALCKADNKEWVDILIISISSHGSCKHATNIIHVWTYTVDYELLFTLVFIIL